MSDLLEYLKAQKKSGINIETSTRCSLKCAQCDRANLYLDKDDKRYKDIKQRIQNGSDLSISNFKKLIDFSSSLILCGQFSDPIWWPHLEDAILLMKKYPEKKLNITTAANRPNIEWYENIFKSCNKNILWTFGIDGLSDTSMIYRQGQNSKLMFDVMLLAKKMNISFEWSFIVFDYNEHQIEDAIQFAKDNKITLVLVKTDRTKNGFSAPDKWKPDFTGTQNLIKKGVRVT